MNNVWFMVPARGGSKTIPKKNIRILAGKPLIVYILETLSEVSERSNIIVSTDDEEIIEVSDKYALSHNRSPDTADDVSTLDEVAYEVAMFLKEEHGASEDDIFITVQPTAPFTKKETILKAIEKQRNSICDSVLTVTDDRHLRWSVDSVGDAIPLFDERVNRQQMSPVLAETGGVITTTVGFILKNRTRISKNTSLIEVDEKEGLDIDTFAQWALAEYWLNKLRIFVRVDGGRKLGFGHLYRALAIAQNINTHEISFVVLNSTKGNDMARQFLLRQHYPLIEVESNDHFLEIIPDLKPDIVINDILDTDQKYIQSLKEYGAFVVNFEDLGEGNRLADIVINDLYPDLFPNKNHWYGVEHAILNPNFEMSEPCLPPNGRVKNILLAYGGSDPSNLTKKALNALIDIKYDGKVTIVIGVGYRKLEEIERYSEELSCDVKILQNVKNMASVMKKADLALTSAGRTVTELMSVGVPTIAMCQNLREMRHNHASSTFGIINLGLGKSITSAVLSEHIKMFLKDENLRLDMYQRMQKAVKNRSNKAIVSKIFTAYKKRSLHTSIHENN